MSIKLFTTVTFHDTSDGVPIVGTVDGFGRDDEARCTVIYVVVPDTENRRRP